MKKKIKKFGWKPKKEHDANMKDMLSKLPPSVKIDTSNLKVTDQKDLGSSVANSMFFVLQMKNKKGKDKL